MCVVNQRRNKTVRPGEVGVWVRGAALGNIIDRSAGRGGSRSHSRAQSIVAAFCLSVRGMGRGGAAERSSAAAAATAGHPAPLVTAVVYVSRHP